MADSFLDVLKRSGASPAATSTSPAPLTFGAALVAKAHFRHGDGKFRTGKPVLLSELADLEADVPADDPGLLDAVAKYAAGEAPPPIDVAVDPDGKRVLIRGKKRLAAARTTWQETIPVRFTQVAEPFGKAEGAAAPARTLQPIDDRTSYPPFPYDQTVFARLRPDQVPRFLGVLTDPERWPLQTVKLSDLLAMQNRVDTAKVQAKVENGGGHEPIVVALEPGRLHIADGHHDLAAAWLRGEDEKAVRFADLTPVTNVLKADMPVPPRTKVRVKPEYRADNWFLERVGDAIGEVIASWVVQEGENAGKVALAVEWLTPGISGMYRGLDAAKVEVVTEPDTATEDVGKTNPQVPAVGDIVDFDDDRFTDKGPASGPVAAVIRNSVIIDFGSGRPDDLAVVDWSVVTKQAKADRWTKPSGKVWWSVHGKPDDPAPADGVTKSGASPAFTLDAKICKVDNDQRLVFGWFSIVEIDGQPITDREGDRVAPAELEKAAYGHVLNARVASDTHVLIGVGSLVESCIFTIEKQQAMLASLQAMGIPAVLDLHCVGWWGGYYITSDKVWEAVKAGDYVSFSIGGNGTRTPSAGGVG